MTENDMKQLKIENVILVKFQGSRKENSKPEMTTLTPCTPKQWQGHGNVPVQGIFVIYIYYHQKIYFFLKKKLSDKFQKC